MLSIMDEIHQTQVFFVGLAHNHNDLLVECEIHTMVLLLIKNLLVIRHKTDVDLMCTTVDFAFFHTLKKQFKSLPTK